MAMGVWAAQTAAQIGEEKFIAMLRDTTSELARKGMARRNVPKRGLATFTAGMRKMPPLYRHALVAEIPEDTPQVFEYRVSRCLWAKTFREEDAGALGYAMVCSPDLAVASAFSPNLKLTRTKTLMQGHEHCHFRYTMES